MLVLSGCSKNEDASALTVYTSVYPTAYILDYLYGDNLAITSIYPDGSNFEKYELTKTQIDEYSTNDLFVYNSTIDKEKNYAVELLNKNKNLKIIDASLGMSYVNDVSETWLNPSSFLMMASNIKKGLKPFKHPTNINSLDKIKFYEKEKLNKTIKKLYPVVLELKLDGLTIVAYPNGEFVTRGNGSNGEVLNNFPCEPNHSEYPIRGEAFLTQSDFEWINEQQKKQNQPLFANARNAAAGILRRLDKSP